jgi:hypothetical protein
VICDFYWFSTLRIKINAEKNNFKDEGIDMVVANKPTFNNINYSSFATMHYNACAAA